MSPKKKNEPTLKGLTKQVEVLRQWIVALKDDAKMGSWTMADWKRYHRGKKPDESGGPPPYPQ